MHSVVAHIHGTPTHECLLGSSHQYKPQVTTNTRPTMLTFSWVCTMAIRSVKVVGHRLAIGFLSIVDRRLHSSPITASFLAMHCVTISCFLWAILCADGILLCAGLRNCTGRHGVLLSSLAIAFLLPRSALLCSDDIAGQMFEHPRCRVQHLKSVNYISS